MLHRAAQDPQTGIRRVAFQRNFDSGGQRTVVKRFEQIAVGRGFGGPLDGVIVGIGGEKNHRHIAELADRSGDFDAVGIAAHMHVHQDEIGLPGAELGQRAFEIVGNLQHLVAGAGEATFEVECDQRFVFNNEQARFALPACARIGRQFHSCSLGRCPLPAGVDVGCFWSSAHRAAQAGPDDGLKTPFRSILDCYPDRPQDQF